MGSWDCYCAICGFSFPSSPQNIAVRPGRTNTAQPGAGDQQDDPAERNEVNEEGDYFDADLLSEGDVAWLCTLHALVSWSDQVFVTGPGTYEDSAMVNVGIGDDPDFDESAEILCYDGSYPFHWPCYQILGSVLAGKQGVAGINKFRLFDSLVRLTSICDTALSGVDLGAAAPLQDQFWTEGRGLELTAVNPMISADLLATSDLIQRLVAGASLPMITPDLHPRVKSDPFRQLPSEIIHQLCKNLPKESMSNLMQASWTVSETVRRSISFWKSRIKIDMPWAFEIHSFLDSVADENQPSVYPKLQDWQYWHYKELYTSLDKTIDPKPFFRGSLIVLKLANRRRIWYVCTQIKAVYDTMCEIEQM